MYIFSRTTVAAPGKQVEAVTAAVSIAAKVTQITSHPVHVAGVQFGAPLGTIMWIAEFESNAQRQDMADKLLADPGYMESVAELAEVFAMPAEDRLGRLLTEPVEPTSRFYGITRATMADGKFPEAVEFGIEIATYVKAELGLQTSFSRLESGGGFGDVSWAVAFDTAADQDRFSDWQMTDAGYQQRVTAAGDLFVTGSGATSLVEKLN